jgi:hypothetical protein
LTEELETSDAAVFAKLAGPNAADPETGNAKFKIVRVLAGEKVLGDRKELETVFFGKPDPEQLFLITGIGTEYTEWATPLPLSPAAVEYIGRLPDVPDEGADRLAYFQEYFENEDTLLAQDAYEEFARAPYSEVKSLGSRMHHDRLIAWISNPATNPSRKRLYLTMLGVCGSKSDLPMLEKMITSGYEEKQPFIEPMVAAGLAMGGPLDLPSWPELVRMDERRKKLGLDAMIGCYLVLQGPDGLDLIDEEFFKPAKVEYSYVYAASLALRFIAEETNIVPRDRLLRSARLLLDNDQFADQIILDLARWEDWSVMDRLIEMFKKSDASGYVRAPIVAYLLAAVEQTGPVGEKANRAVAELERIDAEAVKRARTQMAFGFLQRAKTVAPAAGAQRSDSQAAGEPDGSAANANVSDGLSAAASGADGASSAEIPPDPAAFVAKGSVGTDRTGRNGAQVAAAEPAPTATVTGLNGTSATATEASPETLNTFLVIGLPLAAAALLVAVFWIILRGNAL